jgi:hypothetical protein
LRAARERRQLLEIDAIADRPTHFTLRRRLHFETISNARLCGAGSRTAEIGANTELPRDRTGMRAWSADCELT